MLGKILGWHVGSPDLGGSVSVSGGSLLDFLLPFLLISNLGGEVGLGEFIIFGFLGFLFWHSLHEVIGSSLNLLLLSILRGGRWHLSLSDNGLSRSYSLIGGWCILSDFGLGSSSLLSKGIS